MAHKMEGIDIPDWSVIKSYFTAVDRQHMLSVTGGSLDLWDCNSVKTNGQAIWTQVSQGNMPPGNPWGSDKLNNFYSWWKQGTCPPAAKKK